MENQHRKITGYRELSQVEIDLMNLSKELASAVGALVMNIEANPDMDQRWVQEAKINLQTGFMQLVRSIAKPSTF